MTILILWLLLVIVFIGSALWLLLVIVFIGSALIVAGREEDQSL